MEKYNLKIELVDFLQESKVNIYKNKRNLIFKIEISPPIKFELFEFFISNGDITLYLDANNRYKLNDVSGCISIEKIKNKTITPPNYLIANIYFDFVNRITGGAYLEDFHGFSSNIYFDKNTGWLQIGEKCKDTKAYSCSNGIIICEDNGNITTIYLHIR